MVDVNVDPFEGWEQEPVPVEVIVGYAYEHLNDYINWKDDNGNAFLPTLLSVLHVESAGLKQFVKAAGSEESYGLFQIYWPSHKKRISQHYPQISKFNKI